MFNKLNFSLLSPIFSSFCTTFQLIKPIFLLESKIAVVFPAGQIRRHVGRQPSFNWPSFYLYWGYHPQTPSLHSPSGWLTGCRLGTGQGLGYRVVWALGVVLPCGAY